MKVSKYTIMLYYAMTVLLEYIDHHKCLTLLLIFILYFPIMVALYLMLSMTHYAQNYASIIGVSLISTNFIVCSILLCNSLINFLHLLYVVFFLYANTQILWDKWLSVFILLCSILSLQAMQSLHPTSV